MSALQKNHIVWKSWPPLAGRPGGSVSKNNAPVEKDEESIDQVKEVLAPADNSESDNIEMESTSTENQPDSVKTADRPDLADSKNEAAAPTAEESGEDRALPFMPPPCPTNVCPHKELARAYIVYQEYGDTYDPREALCRGTLFPGPYSLWRR